MYLLPRVARYLVYTNVFVSLCAAALAYSSLILLGLTETYIIWFTFFSTFASYNFIRLCQVRGSLGVPQAPLHRWINEHRRLIGVFVAVGLVGAAYHFLRFRPLTQWLIVPLGAFSFLYTICLPLTGRKGLRELPGFKIFLISMLWAMATVVLPAAEGGVFGTVEGALMTLERFLFIFAITLPFDIRDLPFDRARLHTLPQRFGISKAKKIGFLALLAMDLIIVLEWSTGLYSLTEMLCLIGVAELAAVALFLSDPDRPEPYFSVGVESLSLLWLGAVWLAQLF